MWNALGTGDNGNSARSGKVVRANPVFQELRNCHSCGVLTLNRAQPPADLFDTPGRPLHPNRETTSPWLAAPMRPCVRGRLFANDLKGPVTQQDDAGMRTFRQ